MAISIKSTATADRAERGKKNGTWGIDKIVESGKKSGLFGA